MKPVNHATDETQFEGLRPWLFSIAYRMMGSVMDAEDAVQETYLRWERSSTVPRSLRAFLSTLITRVCIDELRRAYRKREHYPGPYLADPIAVNMAGEETSAHVNTTTPSLAGPSDPAGRSELLESLDLAVMQLMDRLNPVERAVYVLREAFDFPFEEIASIVEKSPSNCRQILHRARGAIEDERRGSGKPAVADARQLLNSFHQACVTGDLEGLIKLLSADVRLQSDGGGRVTAARNPIHGADHVGRFLLGVLGKLGSAEAVVVPAAINGDPGFVLVVNRRVYACMALRVNSDGAINDIFSVLNPDKLGHLVCTPA